MPYVITGDPSGISNTLTRTITDATNASPIVVTTSVPHLFGNGDTVVVRDVGGNTAANGTHQITKISPTTFSLDGSTGSGAYTSGGTVTDVSLTPQFEIPADGDPMDAASINVGLETLADRTQYLALIARMQKKEFTADGTWDAPADCQQFGLIVGSGGGGGGAGGHTATTSANKLHSGGGGGGGAALAIIPVALVAGSTYDVTVGDGGAGGAAGLDGADGEDSVVELTGTPIAILRGAGQGAACIGEATSGTDYLVALGGTPVAQGVPPGNGSIPIAQPLFVTPPPGNGGLGTTRTSTVSSYFAENGQAASGVAAAVALGGTAGTSGTLSGTYHGGGLGGGGGGGPFGSGGAGGNGGNGNNAGAGTAGTAGASASANTGAGGGAGGAGGAGSASGGAGGAGGNGGSGRITIYYFGSPS